MKQWSVQNAKARFSEMLDTCVNNGPQLVTKRGQNAAVLVPYNEWLLMSQRPRMSLKELLLDPKRRADLLLPERGRSQWRKPEKLD